MAMGIGQQIKGMVRRARTYWAELTDEPGKQQKRAREEQEEAVHQRYGGVRGQGERDVDAMLRDRQENSQDRGPSDAELANPTVRATRAGQGGQLGGQSRGSAQMQADSQTQRQYAQQGGSGIQKPLSEQLGSNAGSDQADQADTVRGAQSRRPGQQSR